MAEQPRSTSPRSVAADPAVLTDRLERLADALNGGHIKPDEAHTRQGQLARLYDAPAVGGAAALAVRMWPIDLEPPPLSGWEARYIRWNGEDVKVHYDPARTDVVLVRGDAVERDEHGADEPLHPPAPGCVHYGTDNGGTQLWIKDRREAAMDRLRRLRAAPTLEPPAASLDA